MAKIDVKHTKIFASIAATGATGVTSEFGSYANGDPEYSSDIDAIQSRSAWNEGFSLAVDANNAPMIQDLNSLFYTLTSQLFYMMQEGISEWVATKTYYIGSFVKTSDGRVFMSLTDDNLNHAVTVTTEWIAVITNKVASPSDDYAIAYDIGIVFANKGSAITITVPAPDSTNAGREIIIKNINTGTCAVVVSGGSTIAGNATTNLSQYGAMVIRSEGTKWDLLKKHPEV